MFITHRALVPIKLPYVFNTIGDTLLLGYFVGVFLFVSGPKHIKFYLKDKWVGYVNLLILAGVYSKLKKNNI